MTGKQDAFLQILADQDDGLPLMLPRPARPPLRELTWRVAGVWTVIVALGLAIVGLILAVQQARSLSISIMNQAELRARELAKDTNAEFEGRLTGALERVARQRRLRAFANWYKPSSWPSWIDGLYVQDDRTFTALIDAEANSEAIANLVAGRLAVRTFGQSPSLHVNRPEILYDVLGELPIVLALWTAPDEIGNPLIIAARIDHLRLRHDLILPLLPPDGSLELVAAGRASRWAQQLGPGMRFWAVQPTEAFRREQRNAVVLQALTYVGLTILALGSMLTAMLLLIKAARRSLALAEMKSHFVADVSHELKTPLALIRMFAETLQSGRVTSEEKRNEYYGIITRESTRLTALIDGILDFARINAGKKDYMFSPGDVAAVVQDTYEAYRYELDHKGFEHHLRIDDDLPTVHMDRDAISQVVLNLISNAMKYTDDEKFVDIEVVRDMRRGRRGVLIMVHDHGIGIRPEDRRHLFEGFYRATDGRVRQRGGTGLGLALAKHIVDSHDGLLDCEPRLVKGTTFRVFLPAADVSDVAPASPANGNNADVPARDSEGGSTLGRAGGDVANADHRSDGE